MSRSAIIIRIISGLTLCFIVNSCSHSFNVNVVVPAEYLNADNSNVSLYLLKDSDYKNLQKIKDNNSNYYQSKIRSVYDSLKHIEAEYSKILREYHEAAAECSTLSKSLTTEYCSKIRVTPNSLLRNGDLWKLIAEFTNTGDEDVWELFISVKFQDTYIINKEHYFLLILPHESILFKNIDFDLSKNPQLQYSLVSYPGGLNALIKEALVIEIDSTISTFSFSLDKCNRDMEVFEKQLEKIGIFYDVFSVELCSYLEKSVLDPVNNILRSQLRNFEAKTFSDAADTIRFNQLEKGQYQLLVCTETGPGALERIIPVNLSGNINIDLMRYSPQSIFISAESFILKIPDLPDK